MFELEASSPDKFKNCLVRQQLNLTNNNLTIIVQLQI